MLRLVTTRELDELRAAVRLLTNERNAARTESTGLRKELALSAQAQQFYRTEAEKWERRASKFIDQVAIAHGMLAAPAMQDPPQSRPDSARRIMAAIGIDTLPSKQSVRPADALTGVSEAAAAAAVAGVLSE